MLPYHDCMNQALSIFMTTCLTLCYGCCDFDSSIWIDLKSLLKSVTLPLIYYHRQNPIWTEFFKHFILIPEKNIPTFL